MYYRQLRGPADKDVGGQVQARASTLNSPRLRRQGQSPPLMPSASALR